MASVKIFFSCMSYSLNLRLYLYFEESEMSEVLKF